jgi:murein L,D-transpeptidase YafK
MALLAACDSGPRFLTYDGPEVTSVVVYKGRRSMYLLHEDQVLKSYFIDLGFAPEGPKQVRGDGKTPEGIYRINRRNPRSAYHLSIGISYPDVNDVARARAMGMDPGGDIFIHGTPRRYVDKADWTAGCIAVMNDEMEEIYAMVRDGTTVFLYP